MVTSYFNDFSVINISTIEHNFQFSNKRSIIAANQLYEKCRK